MLGANEWCSGYSIASVLTQLQAGFFDFIGSSTNQIKQQARETLEFKCQSCIHNGVENTWPSFEAKALKTYDKMTEEEKVIDDTYCFHT